jgi:DNA-binding ferritin-like protein
LLLLKFGCYKKIDRLAEQGVEVETAKWEPRSVIYYMGRKVCHAEDGSFSSTNQPMNDLIQRITKVTEEVIQGTHTSNREKDVLTQALENKEHPGRTRGTGVVPWMLAF